MKELIDSFIKNFNSDEQYANQVKKAISDSGILLEEQTKLILSKCGFTIGHNKYIDVSSEEKKTREIDIYAELKKSVNLKINIENFTIELNPVLIGDCKYLGHEDKFFLVTPMRITNEGNFALSMPLMTNGQTYIRAGSQDNSFILSEFKKRYPKELIFSERIEVLKVHGTKKEIEIIKDTESDKKNKEERMFTICDNQILPALEFFYDREFNQMKSFYDVIGKHIPSNVDRMDIDYQRLLGGHHLVINLIFPLVITNRELLSVEYTRRSFKLDIKGFRKLDYFIYHHFPITPRKYPKIMRNRWNQSIIVCNINKLESCIKNIKTFIDNLKKEMEETLNKSPNLIINDYEDYSSDLRELYNLI